MPCVTELPLGWSSVTEVGNGRVVYDFTVMQRSSPDVTVTFAKAGEGTHQPGVTLYEVTQGRFEPGAPPLDRLD